MNFSRFPSLLPAGITLAAVVAITTSPVQAQSPFSEEGEVPRDDPVIFFDSLRVRPKTLAQFQGKTAQVEIVRGAKALSFPKDAQEGILYIKLVGDTLNPELSDNSADPVYPIVVVNGSRVTNDDLYKLKEKTIAKLEVLGPEAAKAKYGEAAVSGALLVTVIKDLPKGSKPSKSSKSTAKKSTAGTQ